MKVELKNLMKKFSNKIVLSDVSFTVESGDMICLLGPSGAGKTTLIRLITGASKSDKGDILIDSIQVPNWDLIKGIGFMPQENALYTDISGFDNLKFFGRLYGLSGKALNHRTNEVLELVQLEDDKDKLVSQYSGGMKKRLSLAIALLHNPKLLLLDEPTVGIDPVLRKSIWDNFQQINRSGVTIIVSTHVMDEATRCEKAALIYHGRLIEYDFVEKLVSKIPNGNLEELFFMAEEK